MSSMEFISLFILRDPVSGCMFLSLNLLEQAKESASPLYEARSDFFEGGLDRTNLLPVAGIPPKPTSNSGSCDKALVAAEIASFNISFEGESGGIKRVYSSKESAAESSISSLKHL